MQATSNRWLVPPSAEVLTSIGRHTCSSSTSSPSAWTRSGGHCSHGLAPPLPEINPRVSVKLPRLVPLLIRGFAQRLMIA